MIKLFIFMVLTLAISGCAVERPSTISLLSYKGKDFTYKENKESTIVLIFPSKVTGLQELSNYRGVYGAFAYRINSGWGFPFKNTNYIVDYDTNIEKYKNNIDYYIVKIAISDYGSNASNDSTKCMSLETHISSVPHTSDSTYIYKGMLCAGITDVRIIAQNVYDNFDSLWQEEIYRNILSRITTIDSVQSDSKLDVLLGYAKGSISNPVNINKSTGAIIQRD